MVSHSPTISFHLQIHLDGIEETGSESRQHNNNNNGNAFVAGDGDDDDGDTGSNSRRNDGTVEYSGNFIVENNSTENKIREKRVPLRKTLLSRQKLYQIFEGKFTA